MFDDDDVDGPPPDVAADPGAFGLITTLDDADLRELRGAFPDPEAEAAQWAAFVDAQRIGPGRPAQNVGFSPPTERAEPTPGSTADRHVTAEADNADAPVGTGTRTGRRLRDGVGGSRPDTPEPWADRLTSTAPGADLATLLEALPIRELTADDVVEAAAGWNRLIAWAGAQRAAAVAELTRRPEMQPAATAPGHRSVHPVSITGSEIAVPLALTTVQAESLTGRSVTLVEDLPYTHIAWAEGRLDENRARIIADELAAHDTRVRGLVQAAILPHVHGWDSTVLRRSIAAILHELVPDTMAERRQRAAQRRWVRITPAPDGMAYLEAFLPAEDATAIKTVLDAAATTMRHHDRTAARTNQPPAGDGDPDRHGSHRSHRSDDPSGRHSPTDPDTGGPASVPAPASAQGPAATPGPAAGEFGADGPTENAGSRVRTLDQCRADALAGIAWHALRTGQLPDGPLPGTGLTRHGHQPVRVNVTIPITALLGLNDTPGHLDGYGPIPAHVARRLATDSTWRRLLTDPVEGALVHVGRTRYAPPPDLAEHVRTRHRECTMPGCHTPAIGCQLDHTVPYPAGTTSAGNLAPLCRHHHLAKHHTGWRVAQPRPGTLVWTSPTGRTHTITPWAAGR